MSRGWGVRNSRILEGMCAENRPYRRWIGICILVASVCSCGKPGGKPVALQHHDTTSPTKNLLLIVVDTLRADYVGVYGGSVATPNLDRVAREGVRFTHAYSHIPVTGPSHATIFSGVTPLVHGVHRNAQVMEDSVVTLAEVLRQRGLRTGAVVSLGVLQSRFGFDQGFEFYDDRFSGQWFRPAEEVTDAALALIRGWPYDDRYFAFVHYSDPHEPYTPPGCDYPFINVRVDDRRVASVSVNGRGVRIPVELVPGNHVISFENDDGVSRRRFTFQQFKLSPRGAVISLGTGWAEGQSKPESANHTVAFPATLEVKVPGSGSDPVSFELGFFVSQGLSDAEARHMYGLEVEYADREIGRLLDELERSGRLQNTLLVVTADHGEGLGDHGLKGHVHQLYDSLIRVPLLIVMPGVDGGVVESRLIRQVDLRPTLLALLGVSEPGPVDGVDISSLLYGQAPDEQLLHLGMTFRPLARAELRSLIVDRCKFIRNEQTLAPELYDLEDDPGEQHNLADLSDGGSVARLEKFNQLLDTLLAASRPGDTVRGEIPLSDDERKMLESLGYVN
jgi:arylsulfatase A-like enzyme